MCVWVHGLECEMRNKRWEDVKRWIETSSKGTKNSIVHIYSTVLSEYLKKFVCTNALSKRTDLVGTIHFHSPTVWTGLLKWSNFRWREMALLANQLICRHVLLLLRTRVVQSYVCAVCERRFCEWGLKWEFRALSFQSINEFWKQA